MATLLEEDQTEQTVQAAILDRFLENERLVNSGMEARVMKISLNQCPFPHNSHQKTLWERGWKQAEALFCGAVFKARQRYSNPYPPQSLEADFWEKGYQMKYGDEELAVLLGKSQP